jgi:hypothetical protein
MEEMKERDTINYKLSNTTSVDLKTFTKDDNLYLFIFESNHPEALILHWGVSYKSNPKDWNTPPKEILPEETVIMDNKKTVQTKFKFEGNHQKISIRIPLIDPELPITTLNFVFYEPKKVFIL